MNLRALVLLTALLFLPVKSHSTTVTVIFTRHGIVMGSDSKMTVRDADFSNVSEGTTDKIALVQDRIAVASVGESDIRAGDTHYDFLTWIQGLTLPDNVSVSGFSTIVEKESARVFAGFDVLLKNGFLKQPDPLENCRTFIQYVIAGYEDGAPRIYVVHFYIDWPAEKLVGPKRLWHTEHLTGDLQLHAFGVKEALADIMDERSYAHRQALVRCPKTFRNILAHRDISVDESIALTHVLIGIEESTNPGAVAGEIQVVRVPPQGKAARIRERGPKVAAKPTTPSQH